MNNRYKIVIRGKNVDYFLKEIIKKNIYIYEIINKSKNELIIVVDLVGLREINDIKTSYKYKIIDRYGFLKISYLIKKYYVTLIAFFINILLLVYLSNLIWSIDVVHENKYIRELVYNELKKENILKYHFKVSFDEKENIVKKILKREVDKLEWMEIEEAGTKYIVRVEQRKKNSIADNCISQNIVAKKDAMILEIHADSGEVVKKKMDYVKKGEVLISGIIYNKEDIMAVRCAKGIVYGEVWYKIHLDLPANYYEEKLTGNEVTKLDVNIFNNNYTLSNKYGSYKRKSNFLFGSSIFPISVNLTKYLEVEVINESYNIGDIDSKALKLAEEKLMNKLGQNVSVISKKVLKKSVKESKIIVEVFIRVKEDITDVSSIELNLKE